VKKARVEYATTEACLFDTDSDLRTVRLHDTDLTPCPPAGDGWFMCGSTCGDGRIFWFWTRTTQEGS